MATIILCRNADTNTGDTTSWGGESESMLEPEPEREPDWMADASAESAESALFSAAPLCCGLAKSLAGSEGVNGGWGLSLIHI